ncbi:MAG: nucleotidyl transferase AbiEii/AbiGii toxin family protein [Patescibacteria group bacterium]
MLNQKTHETHLRRLLSSIYLSRDLQNILAFKGGTSLYMFYNLDRFSTDLDFNCLTENLGVETLNKIFQDYHIQDYYNKRNTWFWLLSYQKAQMKIKVEVSKRDYPDTYETKDLLGIPIKVMTKECMFAHKLCAITDRSKLQNRDLYDTLFMLKNNFEIKQEIIKLRTGNTLKEYLEHLIEFIPKNIKTNHILDGLGEVLTENQKDWAKSQLLPLLLMEIQNRLREIS